MPTAKKSTARKKGAAKKQSSTAKFPQHVVAMTYFVLVLSFIFLTMVVIRYVTHAPQM